MKSIREIQKLNPEYYKDPTQEEGNALMNKIYKASITMKGADLTPREVLLLHFILEESGLMLPGGKPQ